MAFESLSDRLAGVFKRLRGKGKLTEADIKAAMREVRTALLEADVNYKVAKEFIAGVTERAMGQEVMESLTPAQQVVKIVSEELTALMGGNEAARIHIKSKPPTVLMLCGLQGNGKTTHAAKLGKWFLKQGNRPLLVACDVYRPAAIDQLQVVGKQAGVPVFAMGTEKPEEIAKKAVAVDGIILTKTDGDTRGGAALSVLAVTGRPIKFQGTGEKLDDLEVFHPGRMASRILGMGDVLTLIEKAQATQDEQKAAETAKRMMENRFDMNDMLDQLSQMKKMGGASAMLSMLPGGAKVNPDEVDEGVFSRIEAIIYSMTPAEREKPSIINPKRKRRIAAGSGTSVEEVNKLLRQFEMMQKMMKQFKKNPKASGRRMGRGF